MPRPRLPSTLILALGALALSLAACGPKEEAAPASAPTAAPTAAVPAAPEAPSAPGGAATAAAFPADAAELELGKSVYGKTCAMCHAAGVAGAPRPGDAADWGPRRAQGLDVLLRHATEGFTGAKGQMPAKGGNPSISDAELRAAVVYMATK